MSRASTRARTVVADFLRTETAGAKLLLAATVVALLWANSPVDDAYDSLWQRELPFGRISDLRHLINDGLMTVFFLVVGLEIRRELRGGELSSRKAAALPIVAAVGGMLLPAGIYAAFNAGGPGGPGWGIPTATDIAFAVGIVGLFGSRVPSGAKVFLLSLAIADDIGAIIVIAVFYAHGIEPLWLGASAVVVAAIVAARERIPESLIWAGGIALWVTVLMSGIHPTIAGVAFAAAMPHDLAEKSDDALHAASSLFILPLFALANAGLNLDPSSLGRSLSSPVGIGVALGLVLGKTVGITVASWIAVRSRVARLPEATTWHHVVALAATAGVGFTVALFISDLAFEASSVVADARVGVLAGSLVAAVLGGALLYRATR